jgi:hypothetical protein
MPAELSTQIQPSSTLPSCSVPQIKRSNSESLKSLSARLACSHRSVLTALSTLLSSQSTLLNSLCELSPRFTATLPAGGFTPEWSGS